MRAAMRCTAPMKAPSPPPTMPRRMRPPVRPSVCSLASSLANNPLQQGRKLGPNTRSPRDHRAAALQPTYRQKITHPAAGFLDENNPGHDVPGIEMQFNETIKPAAGYIGE